MKLFPKRTSFYLRKKMCSIDELSCLFKKQSTISETPPSEYTLINVSEIDEIPAATIKSINSLYYFFDLI